MEEVIQRPPRIPAWNYDGTNWSEIEAEAEGLGMVLVAEVDGDGNVTLIIDMLGTPTEVPVPTGSWLVRAGANTLSVLTQEQFDAAYVLDEDIPPGLPDETA